MSTSYRIPTRATWLGGAVGLAAAAYLAQAGWSWLRFGVVAPADGAKAEPLLDVFMPLYDIVERHHVRIEAPADVALAAAADVDLLQSPLARAVFKMRELALGGEPDTRVHPRALREQMRSIGWDVLAEVPGREIVFGAVAKPWDADPGFRPVGSAFFAGFDEPGYVKIIWTLRADPAAGGACVFRTETRATATDPTSRARFRRYWALVAPGVRLIRRAMLDPIRQEAERRARMSRAA
jgi:hypothetical protein